MWWFDVYRISATQRKGNIFKYRVEWRSREHVLFQRKTDCISKIVRDRAKIIELFHMT